MPGRFGILKTLLACAALVLCWPGVASAHRLMLDYRVLPDRRVQVEGWYSSAANPHPAATAKVEVRRTDGTHLIDGELDANGTFTFSVDRPQDLSVVVSQIGHRAEVTIAATQLGSPSTDGTGDAASPARSDAPPRGHSSFHDWVLEMMVQIGFVLALAAFVLSVWNARRLRELRRERDK